MNRRGLVWGIAALSAAMGCGKSLTPDSGSDEPPCGAGAIVTERALPGGATPDNGRDPLQPEAIVTGPDGNLWMTEVGLNAIGRLTPDGRLDSFPVPQLPSPAATITGIAVGGDGNIWFTECPNAEPRPGGVGRITPDGQITQFNLPGDASRCLMHPTLGPDGNIWFSEWTANALGRVTSDGVFTEFFLPGTSDWRDIPWQFVVGPDGSLWFGEIERLGKVSVAGDATFYPAAVLPDQGAGDGGAITVGPDGNLWWTGPFSDRMRRIAVPAPGDSQIEFRDFLAPGRNSGTAQRFSDLTPGPDGNIWYAGWSNVGCVTPDGKFHDIAVPNGSPLGHMSLGPDGALWFTEPAEDRIGRVQL